MADRYDAEAEARALGDEMLTLDREEAESDAYSAAILTVLRAAYEAGARDMRERAAAVLRDPMVRHSYVLLGPRVLMHAADMIEALPLTPDTERSGD
jgi:hypothetical protein